MNSQYGGRRVRSSGPSIAEISGSAVGACIDTNLVVFLAATSVDPRKAHGSGSPEAVSPGVVASKD